MKKVLIISYYWPPAGGSGVQRWLKFSKYLLDYGWKPIIVTPENPYNELKQMISSYRIRATRDALVGNDLADIDKMGTYIEDYEYVEGLGDLDQYNGRFCVTP